MTVSPRRRQAAQRLLSYIRWHGGTLFLDERQYGDVEQQTGLDEWSVKLAADDLCDMGAVSMEVRGSGAGEMLSLRIVRENMSTEAVEPAATVPMKRTQLVTVQRKRGRR